MSRRTLAALAALVVVSVARVAGAQGGAIDPQCSAQPRAAQDVCQKSIDLFRFTAPQLGAVIAGGNPELGQGGTLGGPGHFGIGLRVSGMRAPLPQYDNVSIGTTGPNATVTPTSQQWVGFPTVDAAIGIFKGLPLGLTRIGGVDLLLNGVYVPTIEENDFAVRTTGGSFKVGYGARVGILQESVLVPGVGFSYLRRETPTTSLIGTVQNDSIGVTGLSQTTDSWRLTAGKRFLFFGVAVGVGQDAYDARASLGGVVNDPLVGRVPVNGITARQKLTRTNYFANLTLLQVPFFRLVGEIGRSTGGSASPTYNSFDGRAPDAAYTYGSVGLRFGR